MHTTNGGWEGDCSGSLSWRQHPLTLAGGRDEFKDKGEKGDSQSNQVEEVDPIDVLKGDLLLVTITIMCHHDGSVVGSAPKLQYVVLPGQKMKMMFRKVFGKCSGTTQNMS